MNEKSTSASIAQTDPSTCLSPETSFSISEMAREFGITTRAIRFYEDEKLINPGRIGRQRSYSVRDHTRLKLILRGKRLGFSLGEIRGMLDLYDSEPGEEAQLQLALSKASERRRVLEQQLDDIQISMDEITEFENQCRARLEELK